MQFFGLYFIYSDSLAVSAFESAETVNGAALKYGTGGIYVFYYVFFIIVLFLFKVKKLPRLIYIFKMFIL